MAHAEALLLVDDQKSQIFKMHIFLQQFVRADNEINFAGLQLLQSLFHLRRRAEARQHVDRHRERAEAFESGQIMLLRKHRCRDQNRGLLAV